MGAGISLCDPQSFSSVVPSFQECCVGGHTYLTVSFTPEFPRDSSPLSVICPCLLASLVCAVDGSPLCEHVSLMNKAAVDAYIFFSLNVSVHFSVVNAQKCSSLAF